MSKGAFARVANGIKDSKYVIPVTFAVLIGVIIGGFASYEDYRSSYHGYNMLPTRKSGEEIVQVIALLPQVGQIIFFYMFGVSLVRLPSGRHKANYIYFTIAFFLLLFDLGTDMFFKASGFPAYVWVIAFIESITVYNIGSELLLTSCLGLMFELVPEALKQLGQVFANLFGGDDEDEIGNRQQQHSRN